MDERRGRGALPSKSTYLPPLLAASLLAYFDARPAPVGVLLAFRLKLHVVRLVWQLANFGKRDFGRCVRW